MLVNLSYSNWEVIFIRAILLANNNIHMVDSVEGGEICDSWPKTSDTFWVTKTRLFSPLLCTMFKKQPEIILSHLTRAVKILYI